MEILNGICTFFKFVYTANEAVQVVKKISDYDPDTWEFQDYLETASRISFVTADTFSLATELEERSKIREVEKLKAEKKDAKCDKVKSDLKTRIDNTKKEIQSIGEERTKFAAIGLGAHVVQDACRRGIGVHNLANPTVLMRTAVVLRQTDPLTSYVMERGADIWMGLSVLLPYLEQEPEELQQAAANPQQAAANPQQVLRNPRDQIIHHNQNLAQGQDLLTIPPHGDYQVIEIDDNPVFNQYICAILQIPCRYPAYLEYVDRDGNVVNRVYYEFAAIRQWIQTRHTDPNTRQPLTLNAIRIDLLALRLIEDEMRRLGLPLV